MDSEDPLKKEFDQLDKDYQGRFEALKGMGTKLIDLRDKFLKAPAKALKRSRLAVYS
jgi:hypothetical protein